jgi:ribosomal subunit interface protein
MQIHIQGHKLKISQSETDYIHQKMEKIIRLAHRLKDDSSEIRVDVYHKTTKSPEDAISCTITLYVPKATLRGESHGNKVCESIDLAKQKLIPQIEAYKEKFTKNK